MSSYFRTTTLEHFGESGSIFDGFHSSTHEVLNKIVIRHPAEIWRQIEKYLDVQGDSRSYHIRQWLRGEESALGGNALSPMMFFPLEDIFHWVEKHVTERAWYLATFVSPHLTSDQGNISLMREVLVRYGDREDVRRNLSANYSTGGWVGPESLHYQQRKDELQKFKANETNSRVIKWIAEYISMLDAEIERAKIREERDGF